MTMLSLIVAVSENGVIGNEGKLPWHIPEDLAWFKRKTIGKPILMGRKTFQSLKRLLPGRPHVVISRDSSFVVPEGVATATSIKEGLIKALPLVNHYNEIVVIGGAQIYEQTLPIVDRIYLTTVQKSYNGDSVLCMNEQHFDRTKWTLTESKTLFNNPKLTFETWNNPLGLSAY